MTLASANTKLTLVSGAQVLAGPSAAIVNDADSTAMTIDGAVAGGTRPGVLFTAGHLYYVPCDPYAGASFEYCYPGSWVPRYSMSTSAITVGATGSISGSTAILLTRENGGGSSTASIDNSGSLSASAGPALVAPDGAIFSQIRNRVGGFIGGIVTGSYAYNSSSITNEGAIDGGGNAAISSSADSIRITNSGQIGSSSDAATVFGKSVSIDNSGTIRNSGSGAAVEAMNGASISNATGGLIATGGTTAISSGTWQLSLTNAGIVRGSVVSGGPIQLTNTGTIEGSVRAGTGYSVSTVDLRGGTITGDLMLGTGDDTVKAQVDAATGRIAGVSGTIDAGAGSNLLQLTVAADTTIGGAALVGGFSRLGLQVSGGAKVTLSRDAGGGQLIEASGNGVLINDVDLTTNGAAITTSYSAYGERLDVENHGAIVSTPVSSYLSAVNVNYGSFTNTGSIRSSGVGVQVQSTADGTLTNGGSITGTTTGASASYVDVVNSGTIAAIGGTGLALYRGAATGTGSLNSGTISGAVALALGDARLANSGTISGTATGVVLGMSARLDNLAGGIITGGTAAITSLNGYALSVRNAGTINGDVRLDGSPYYGATFVDVGGTVNGALRLGDGNDTVVVQVSGAAGRPLAGMTGGIDTGAGFDTLRYYTSVDASSSVTQAAGFDAVGYEVASGAKLRLTSAAALDQTARFSGKGVIDFTGNITVQGQLALDLTGLSVDELMAGGRDYNAPANPDLTVISRGRISALNLGSAYYGTGCAVDAGGASFENAGSIAAGKASEGWGANAICNGTKIVNSGAITVADGNGVAGSGALVNSGSIAVTVSAADPNSYRSISAVSGMQDVTNSGTISVSSVDQTPGVTAISGRNVTNSGTIENRAGTAISLYAGGVVVNEAAGVIRGNTVAISGTTASIINRGTIIGRVVLMGNNFQLPFDSGIRPAAVAPGSQYTADGGTLQGDLLFGAGNDRFVQLSGTTGVTGAIDGGAGADQVILGGTGAGTFTGVTNFERLDVTSGSWTITAPPSFGMGTGIAAGATLIGTTGTLLGAIENQGTLRVDQAFDGMFAGVLSGNGKLEKAGTGTVTFSAQPSFTGTMRVLGGNLAYVGNSAARVDIGGGSFVGSGEIASLAVGQGGSVSPGGGTIATLAVTGELTQANGSSYIATIAANGQSDRIVVGGKATLASGAQLVAVGTLGTIGTRYTLLTAAGGVSGSYGLVQPGSGATELRLAQSATIVSADVVRSQSGLIGLAATANQRAAASGLAKASLPYLAITTEANDASARVGLDALSGEVHAALASVRVRDARVLDAAVLNRTLAHGEQAGLWGTLLTSHGTEDGSSETAETRHTTRGGVLGVDRRAGSATIGFAGGYTRTTLGGALAHNARVETFHALGYVGWSAGPVQLRAGVGYAWSDNRTDRTVALPGLREEIGASYRGHLLHGFAEAGYAVALGGASLQPFAGIESYRVSGDAFAEAGGSAALNGTVRSQTVTFGKAGLRAEVPVLANVALRSNLAWTRRLHRETPGIVAAFSGASAFAVRGTPLARDAARAGVDLVVTPAANLRIIGSYEGFIADREKDHGFRLSASMAF